MEWYFRGDEDLRYRCFLADLGTIRWVTLNRSVHRASVILHKWDCHVNKFDSIGANRCISEQFASITVACWPSLSLVCPLAVLVVPIYIDLVAVLIAAISKQVAFNRRQTQTANQVKSSSDDTYITQQQNYSWNTFIESSYLRFPCARSL